jgi:predicted transcriptional regulator
MSSSIADLAALIYRFIADHGPLTASDVAKALGRDGRQVSNAMARLLDAQRLVVAGVTPDDEPLYAVAVAQAETDDQEGREG